ncbi:MAG: hypothetical protein GY865_05625, partial [candidate division Zixibacteria bacterium]|nr:hypothetical protein [candidate division Zixibacteria bacterium]
MKFIITIIIICLMFNITIASDNTIKSVDKAVAKALEYLGFSDMEGFDADSSFEKASIVNISNDKTPFLHEKINNRDIWKVTYKDIELSPHRGYPDSDDYLRTFDV